MDHVHILKPTSLLQNHTEAIWEHIAFPLPNGAYVSTMFKGFTQGNMDDGTRNGAQAPALKEVIQDK